MLILLQCKTWFKRNSEEGRIVGLWPGSSAHAQTALESPRFEDFTFVQMPETRRNVMTWLGNGLTTAQEANEKTTQYLDTLDVPPAINKGPRPGIKAFQGCFHYIVDGTPFKENIK